MQIDASVFGWSIVATSPSSHAHLFDGVNIEGTFLLQDCLRVHDSSSSASRYQIHLSKSPAEVLPPTTLMVSSRNMAATKKEGDHHFSRKISDQCVKLA